MKTLIAILFLSCSLFGQQTQTAQDKTQEQKNAEQLAAYKKSEDAQKALQDKNAADEKAKAEAAEKLDNKNPQPIKNESDRLRLEKLQARALLDQQKLQTMEAIIKASTQQPIAQAQASAKAYNDALAELQKSHHAEGCIPVLDENGDIKVSKDGKEVWNCAKKEK